MEYRIALAQVAPRLGEVDANFDLLAERLTAAAAEGAALVVFPELRSEEHTSELQSPRCISYAVFCLKKKK